MYGNVKQKSVILREKTERRPELYRLLAKENNVLPVLADLEKPVITQTRVAENKIFVVRNSCAMDDCGSISDTEGRTFEPQIVPKHQREFRGFDDKTLSMYALGLTTRQIQDHLKDIYAVEVSPELISRVTDEVKEMDNAYTGLG